MVYVDDMRPCRPSCKWPYQEAAHLYADTDAELHELAARIGLRRAWFQKRLGLNHYDVTANKRHQAIAAGAQRVTCKHTGEVSLARLRATRDARNTHTPTRR